MSDFIKSLKEFIWDIIGYLVPGFFMILMLNFVLLPIKDFDNSFIISWSKLQEPYIVTVVCYVIGFILYSITLLKITLQDFSISILTKLNWLLFLKRFHSNYWQSKFQATELFKAAKQMIVGFGYANGAQMEISEVRNILMTRAPEMDQKVYTFMFRAAVFDYISTIFLIVFHLFIVQFLLGRFGVKFLKMESGYILLYSFLPLLSGLLGRGKRRFFSIAQRIPFSISK